MIMFRTLAFAAALGALALPAAAASVKINIAGLDAKTAHAHIVRAAQAACSAALNESPVVRYYDMGPCIDDAVAATEAKLAANEHHYASVQSTGR
jgi:UrcA family protein